MQLLRKIAFPFSLLYALVVYLRNYLFNIGVFSSKSYKTTTVCVGNLSAGGTGKTPMIELLISNLQQHYKLAVLSRGYGRKSKGLLIAKNATTVEELGDEPYQIYKKYPAITMVVDGDRRNGIETLEQQIKPDVILLDDAYQHRKVKPTFAILLTAYGNLYVDDWYLPTGNLRDAKNEAKRANVIIVTKCPATINNEECLKIEGKLKLKKHQQLLFASLSYAQELKGFTEGLTLTSFKGKKITLVTGIANPKPLVDFLNTQGVDFEHLAYSDHHFFTAAEIETFASKEFVLTTEKDFVRLKGKLKNLCYIEVQHKILDKGKDKLLSSINDLIK
ncbi:MULTISPECIES: tetraacyldisaccharide 4'-kinase [unclassified Cellulophaga]|uniref:tetraacyldisaccharide 4'-kinase n=1 Tax=unclassified Cellulophaga TaxID=2634405 RepID=UPI0026E2575F|nr:MULTISPECIES: tetraacyldisaccharide 4'-kinase [unclassified Cellulophaga]MDO6492802.1 tetraacyldisaccharide 4'-kinase [Cellulophaga sp. 2_MG-2023]MDO6496238.1 tetraacyldisaccharide 4'-kinase [Cellulophaga sp. 3_MG-2023]